MKNENNISPPRIEEKKLKKSKDFTIVGIGASAGGVEAVSEFLEKLSLTNDLAYVVILHLDPKLKSFLPEIFQRKSSMQVIVAENGTKINRNYIYVIPPGFFMSVLDGHLALSKRGKGTFFHPIDYFFNSLATTYQNKSIGIILSGTATDGTIGLRAIRAEGGITFAQDKTAEFNGMPKSAIDADIVDFILCPADIAEELNTQSRSPVILKATDNILDNEDMVESIFDVLREKKNVDFSGYKRSTVDRRILRRITINKSESLQDYVGMLKDSNNESDQLYNDLLINVTDFFRDENAFSFLKEQVLSLLLDSPNIDEGIRIWVAACSTGEEAYSIAIILFDFLKEKKRSIPFHIFATDSNQNNIEKARKGVYAQSSLLNVPAEMLSKYFSSCPNEHYQIKEFIRGKCVFSTHNLLSDPPFSRVNLVSCQNMLIYLNVNEQYRILQSFHYALKPNGFLWLGKSESIGEADELFQKVEGKVKMYIKKDGLSHLPFYFTAKSNKKSTAVKRKTIDEIRPQFSRENDVEKECDRLLLAKYVTPSVLITSDWKIIRFNGAIAEYLQPATGKASLHLLKMIKEDLLVDLRTVISNAKDSGRPFRKEGIILHRENIRKSLTLEAVPIYSLTPEKYYLVLFIEQNFSSYLSPGEISDQNENDNNQIASRIKVELNEARNQLRYMTNEFENSREELQTANEEVLSSNEELQSINEELETSKEELQSTNEELVVSNEELVQRNAELNEAFEFRQGIVETIREPLIVMNSDMIVLSANRAFYEQFYTHENSIKGLSFFEIEKQQWNIPELKKQLKEIVSKKESFKNIEITSKFAALGERTLIYNSMRMDVSTNSKNQILLALEDITDRRIAEKDLKVAHESNLKVLNSITDIFMSINSAWQFIFINKAAEAYLGKSDREVLGKNIWDVIPSFGNSSFYLKIAEAMKTKKFSEFDLYFEDNQQWFSYRIYPGEESLSIFANNITEHKQALELINQSKERYQTFISKSAEGIWRFEIDNPISIHLPADEQLRQLLENARLAECNDVIANRYGYTKQEDIIGLSMRELLGNSEMFNVIPSFIQSQYRLNDVEIKEEMKNGATNFYLNNLVGIIEDDFLKRIWGTKRNISEQKEVELSLMRTQQKLNLALAENSIATWMWDIKDNTVEWSLEQRLLYGSSECDSHCSFENWLTFIHPEDVHEVETKILLAKENKKETEVEFRVIFPDKSIHWLLLKGSIRLDIDNNAVEMVGVNIDITDRKLLEKEREGFIAIASHELKTPLTSIKAYAEILTEVLLQKNDEKAANLSIKMEKQIDRLHNLIKDLLDVAKLGEGQLQMTPTYFNFNKMAREVVEDMQSITSKHELVLDVHISHKVWGDSNKLREVMINFISNAIKYSPGSDRVFIKARTGIDEITVSVKDFGIGLEKSETSKLFNRFYRVNDSTINTFPGLGLGLFISAEIIKKHHGTIWVESIKGEGSEFFFSIPYSREPDKNL